MSGLTPYLIAELKTGISTYLQPWQRPADAFDPLVNAYVYRGTLNKRNGYITFGNQLADDQPVMGIMQRVDEGTHAISLVVASTRNLYLYNAGPNTFTPLVTVGGINSIFWKGTATGTITVPTFWPNFANGPGTIFITDGTTTVSFGAASAGVGTMTGAGGIFASGSIVYATGVVTLTFNGSTSDTSLSISGTLTTPTSSTGGYFTGNNTNFFNWINWQPTDPVNFVTSVSYLYVTNNVDPVTLFDGTNLSRPIFYVNSAFTDYITKTLDVTVYKNRLLMIRPTLNSTTNPLNQSIYYSALFNPFNFINDIAGNGGQLTAASGDIIQSAEPLRDAFIVFFSSSTWIFRYTGFDLNPFRWDKINSSKNNSVPYGTFTYDEKVTSLGSTGFIACDGANVDRYDINIIDYYETKISGQYYGQCYSTRYDNLNQAWMLYVSNGTSNPVVGGGAPGSDSALIYNFLENSWATYTFSVPMMTLGLFYSQTGATWASMTKSWESQDFSWQSYSNQKLLPILLIGDVNGNVYWIDNEDAVTDNGNTILPNITTTRWNPIIAAGQKAQFVYLDIYYQITSQDPTDPIQLILTFFVDNSGIPAFNRTLTLDGPVGSNFTWKRVYINAIGQFLQMNIDPNENASFQILGFILWAKPSGRLTP